jgi:Tfp pilus assembly protein PilO
MLSDFALRQVRLKFQRLEEEINLKEERLVNLRRILYRSNQIESEYEKVMAGLQPVNSTDELLQEIEFFSEKVGLNIRNIKPIEIREEEMYKIYSLRMETQDSLARLARF